MIECDVVNPGDDGIFAACRDVGGGEIDRCAFCGGGAGECGKAVGERDGFGCYAGSKVELRAVTDVEVAVEFGWHRGLIGAAIGEGEGGSAGLDDVAGEGGIIGVGEGAGVEVGVTSVGVGGGEGKVEGACFNECTGGVAVVNNSGTDGVVSESVEKEFAS